MRLNKLLATAALASVLATPALTQSSVDLRAALRSWGLDRQTASTKFVKKSQTADEFIAENYVEIGADGDEFTASKLIITRLPPSANSTTTGQFRLRLENVQTKDKQGDTAQIGALIVDSLSVGANFRAAVADMGSTSARNFRRNGSTPNSSPDFAGDLRMENGVINSTSESDGKRTKFTFDTMTMENARFAGSLSSVDGVTMSNLAVAEEGFSARLAAVKFSGDGLGLAKFVQAAPGDQSLKLEDIVMSEFSFSGFTMTFVGASPTDVMKGAEVKIGSFSLNDLKDGMLGRFGFSGFSLRGGVGEKAFEMGLERLTLSGLNLRYLAAVGETLSKIVKAPAGDGKSALMADTPSSASPRSPAPPSSKPSPLLKDVFKGGPLDGGIAGMDLKGFNFSFFGFDFLIDTIKFGQERNVAGIVTRAALEPMEFRLKIPSDLDERTGGKSAMFSALLKEDVVMRMSSEARYDPAQDILTISDARTDLVGWGGIRFGMTLGGIGKMYETQTLDRFLDLQTQSLEGGSSDAKGKTDGDASDAAVAKAKARNEASMRMLSDVYKGITIQGGFAILKDLGGLERAASFLTSMTNQARGGTTSRATQPNTQANANLRRSWAAPLRQTAGQKTKPALDRQLSLALARWIEGSGELVFESAPATPIDFGDLEAVSKAPDRWGFKIRYDAPAAN